MKKIEKIAIAVFMTIAMFISLPIEIFAVAESNDTYITDITQGESEEITQPSSSMAVVPGSPADSSTQESSEPIPEPEPSSETPSQEPSSQPQSSTAPSSSVPSQQASSTNRPSQGGAITSSSSEDLSSVPSQNLPKEPSDVPTISDFQNQMQDSEAETISLPDVGEVSGAGELTESGTEVTIENKFNMIGLISWICIGIGIAVVIIVLLSTTRRPPRGGYGRKRYRRKTRKSGKKRLLNDKYYRNLRY